MANEIRITRTINYENGSLKYNYAPGTLNLPQTTRGYSDKTVSVTTAQSDLSLADLGTPGILVLKSLEPTTTGGTVEWGPKTSTDGILKIGKLGPKQENLITVASSTCVLRWQKTAAGTVSVQVLGFEA